MRTVCSYDVCGTDQNESSCNGVKDGLVSGSDRVRGYTLVRKFLDLSAHIRILCPELVLSPRRMNSF